MRKLIKLLFLSSVLLGLMMTSVSVASAAVVTWDGGGGDALWTTALNWDGDVAPGASDVVVFDGTSTKDSTFDLNFCGGTCINSLSINSGYTGTITLSTELNISSSGYFNMHAGTLALGTRGFNTPEVGGFTMDGGTISGASSACVGWEGDVSITGGTWSVPNYCISLTNTTAQSINITIPFLVDTFVDDAAGTVTYADNTVIIVNGGDFYTSGTNNGGTGAYIELRSTTTTSGLTGGTMEIRSTGSDNQNFNLGSTDNPIIINKTGGTVNLRGTVTSGGSITHTAGTVALSNIFHIDSGGTYTQNGGTFNVNNFSFDVSGNFYANGGTVTLGATGLYIYGDGTLTVNGGTFDISSATSVNLAGGLDFQSGTFTGSSTTFLVSSGGTFDVSGGSVTPTSGTFDIDGTLELSGGTLVLPTTTNISGNLTMSSGTLTAGTGTVTFDGVGGTIINDTANTFYNVNLNLTGNTDELVITTGDTLIVSNDLTLSNGTFDTGEIEVRGDIDVLDGFDAGSTGSLLFSGSGTQSGIASDISGLRDLPSFEVNKSGGSMTFTEWADTDGNYTNTAGTVTFQVGLHAEGNYTQEAGTVTMNTNGEALGNIIMNGGTFAVDEYFDTNGTFTMNDGTWTGGTEYSGAYDGPFTLNGGTYNIGTNGLEIGSTGSGSFVQTGGTFNGGSGTWMDVYGDFTKTGGTFNAQTVYLGFPAPSTATQTISTDVDLALYDVYFQYGVHDLSGGTVSVSHELGLFDGTLNNGTLEIGGTISLDATFDGGTADWVFNGTGAQSLNLSAVSSTGILNGDITVDKASGTLTLGSDLVMDAAGQDLTITQGTLDTGNNDISLTGNWANSGTFTAGTGTVTFTDSGATSVVSGSTTFNNLTVATAGKTVNFTAGTTQTVGGTFTITGTSGTPVTLRSSSTGTEWDVNVSGSSSVSYVDVKDSDASGGSEIIASYGSTDSGNNTNWLIQTVPTVSSISASQASDASGDVTINFTIDDANDDDTLQAKIEYSVNGGSNWYDPTLSTVSAETTATYGSPVVDNAQTYQVGQAAGYITSSSGANTISVIWEADTDLDAIDVSNAQIRITPYDGGAAGTVVTSSNFTFDLVAPVGLNDFGPIEASLTYVKFTWTSAGDSNFDHYEIWYGQDLTAVRNRSVAAAEWDNDDVSFLTQATANSTKISVNPNDKYFKIFAVDQFGNASTVTDAFVTVSSSSGGIIHSISSGGSKTTVSEMGGENVEQCDACADLEDTYSADLIDAISDFVHVDSIQALVDEISENVLEEAVSYFDNEASKAFVHSLLDNVSLFQEGKGETLLKNMNKVWAASTSVDLDGGVERDARVDLLMNRIVDFQREMMGTPVLDSAIVDDIEEFWAHVSESLVQDELTLDIMFDLVDRSVVLEDAIELSNFKNNFALKDVPGPFDKGFEDSWYAEAVFSGLGEKWSGYVDENGMPTYKFGPESPTLRAESLKIMLSSFGYDSGAEGAYWWSGWQETADELGLTIANYDLSQEIERGELFRLIYELGEMVGPETCGNVFADLSENEDCQPAVRLKQMGIITGDDATGFVRLYDSLNRAEMAVLSSRVDQWLDLNPDLLSSSDLNWLERLRNLFANLARIFVSVMDIYRFEP